LPRLDARRLAGIGRVVDQTAVASGGWSGNRLERLVLSDGRALIAKHVSPRADWLARATGDDDVREAALFTTGVLGRLPHGIDHAIVAAERDGDGWWIVARDVSGSLLDAHARLSREQSRGILARANLMWQEFWGERPPMLASQEQLLGRHGPAVVEREREGIDLLPKQFEAAWDAFAQAVEADVAEAVLALADDPRPLATELQRCGTTLIHGDLRDEHVALEDDRLVLLDWGLATQAHPAVDFAWYLVHDAWRIDATHDEIVEDFRHVMRQRDDPRAVELGLVAGLVLYGWIFGHSAVVHPDPNERRWARSELAWWVPRVRRALDSVGLHIP
jgi:hypothetical protein